MNRGLAIETSGRVGSVAIVEEGVVVAEDAFSHGLRHAAEMIPRIDALLRGRGWAPRDLHELYVSVGPGSFTGLRIGVTLAKTFAFATGAVVAAVPTEEVLARNAPADAKHVVVVLDAKRGQIFTARLERQGPDDWLVNDPPRLASLTDVLASSPRPVHLIGEGIPQHRKFIPEGDASVIVTPEDTWQARAAVVARIGYRMLREGRAADLQRLAPVYLRKPEAEEKADAGARSGGAAC